MAGSVKQRRVVAGGGASSNSVNDMSFRVYTDDAPGMKIGPQTVLIFSLGFIGSVVLLHIFGKLFR